MLVKFLICAAAIYLSEVSVMALIETCILVCKKSPQRVSAEKDHPSHLSTSELLTYVFSSYFLRSSSCSGMMALCMSGSPVGGLLEM